MDGDDARRGEAGGPVLLEERGDRLVPAERDAGSPESGRNAARGARSAQRRRVCQIGARRHVAHPTRFSFPVRFAYRSARRTPTARAG